MAQLTARRIVLIPGNTGGGVPGDELGYLPYCAGQWIGRPPLTPQGDAGKCVRFLKNMRTVRIVRVSADRWKAFELYG